MATPAPYSVPPSEYWEGNDGPWSSFGILIGTPPQNIRVLPSSTNSETVAVLPQGCLASDPSNCPKSRGFTFAQNASATWHDLGLYTLALPIEQNLGYSGNGAYGTDTLTLSWQGSGGLTLQNQIVGGIATKDLYIGRLPLAPYPLNLTDYNHPHASLLASLKAAGKIPSLSWAYTAGAAYRARKPLGSLVLGGYDRARVPAAAQKAPVFPFGADISRALLVGLQGITSRSDGGDNETLLAGGEGVYSTIDTNVPGIWLPVAACERFERAFGIAWDAGAGLYLVNDTAHDKLVAKNASVTFTFGAQVGNSSGGGGSSVDIVLPYASFDLTTDIPGTNATSRYFPLMRAQNDSQYVLGRTLLQESYLTVDHERQTFSLSQAVFPPAGVPEHLVAILPPTTGSTATAKGHKLPTGVAVGVVLAILLLVGLTGWGLGRWRRRMRRAGKARADPASGEEKPVEVPGNTALPLELPGAPHGQMWELGTGAEGVRAVEVDAGVSSAVFEAANGRAGPAVELEGNGLHYELPAGGAGREALVGGGQRGPGMRTREEAKAGVGGRPFSWEVGSG